MSEFKLKKRKHIIDQGLQKKSYDFLLSLVPNHDKNRRITTDEEKEKWLSEELEKEFPFINFFHDDCYNLEEFEIEDMKKQLVYDIGILYECIEYLKEDEQRIWNRYPRDEKNKVFKKDEQNITDLDFVDRVNVLREQIIEKEAKLKYFDYVLEGRSYDE